MPSWKRISEGADSDGRVLAVMVDSQWTSAAIPLIQDTQATVLCLVVGIGDLAFAPGIGQVRASVAFDLVGRLLRASTNVHAEDSVTLNTKSTWLQNGIVEGLKLLDAARTPTCLRAKSCV